jgi:hypothetical protein
MLTAPPSPHQERVLSLAYTDLASLPRRSWTLCVSETTCQP